MIKLDRLLALAKEKVIRKVIIMPLIKPNQIRHKLQELKGWALVDGKLYKEFTFDNFPMAVLFVNNLVDPVEELDDHPEVVITYNRVKIFIYNNVAGGITDRDFELAKRIDELI